MSAGNDDFIRRRICDLSPTQSGDGERPLRRRSLSQMWAAVQADADDTMHLRKPEPDEPKNPPEHNEE